MTSRRVLSNPTNPSHALVTKNVTATAQSLGVELRLLGARGPDEFERAFMAMAHERAGGLLVEPDPVLGLHRTGS
jgi:putative tryptophan/tyrosine transport system substrate-binding protein